MELNTDSKSLAIITANNRELKHVKAFEKKYGPLKKLLVPKEYMNLMTTFDDKNKLVIDSDKDKDKYHDAILLVCMGWLKAVDHKHLEVTFKLTNLGQNILKKIGHGDLNKFIDTVNNNSMKIVLLGILLFLGSIFAHMAILLLVGSVVLIMGLVAKIAPDIFKSKKKQNELSVMDCIRVMKPQMKKADFQHKAHVLLKCAVVNQQLLPNNPSNPFQELP